MSEAIGRRFAWTSASRVVAALLNAVALALVARWTNPAVFGLFAAVLALTTVAEVALSFGMQTLVLRERARSPRSPLIKAALWFNDWSAYGMAILYVAVIGVAAIALDAVLWQLVPLAIWAAASRNAETWLGVVFADGDVWINAANQVATRLATLCLLVALFAAGVPPVMAYTSGAAVVWLASSTVAHILVKRRVPSLTGRSTLGEALRHARPFWVHSLATQARQLDVVVVALIAPAAQAGYFAVASRLVGPFRTLTTSLAAVMLPTASRRQGHTAIRRLRWLIVLVFVAMGAAYSVAAAMLPSLVPIVLGDQYSSAVPTLQVVVVGMAFGSVVPLQTALLQGLGLKTFVATISIAATVASLILTGLGALLFGGVGAAMGMGIAFAIQAVVLAWRVERFLLNNEQSID